MRLTALVFFAIVTASLASSQTRPAKEPAKEIDDAAAQLSQMNASQARMMETNRKMAEIQAKLNDRITALCNDRKSVTPADTAKALNELCTMSMTFNQQYLTLQMAMQNENRQYTTVSNVLKTKHDTVKNSIGNVR